MLKAKAVSITVNFKKREGKKMLFKYGGKVFLNSNIHIGTEGEMNGHTR